MAVAAAAVLPTPTRAPALPLRVVRLDHPAPIASLLLVRDGVLGVVVNPRLIDEATAIRRAERAVAAGEVFDVWWDDDAA